MGGPLIKNFNQYFHRHFPDDKKFRKEIQPAISVIVAAREPLPVGILQNIFNWEVHQLRDYTTQLASLFPVKGEAGSEVITPINQALVDWLTNKVKAGVNFINEKKGHRLLADAGWKEFEDCLETVRNMSNYFVSFLPNHLHFLNDRTRLNAVGANFPFMIEMYKRGKKSDYSFHDFLKDLPWENSPLKYCWQGSFVRLMILASQESRSSLTSEEIAGKLSTVKWEYQPSTPYDDDCYLMALSPFDNLYYLWAWFTSLSNEPTSIQSHRPPYFDGDRTKGT